MLQLSFIRNNRQDLEKGLEKKGHADLIPSLDEIVSLDDSRKKIQLEQDELRSKLNTISKEIGELFKSGKQEEANKAKAETVLLKEQDEKLGAQSKEVLTKLQSLLVKLPNMPHQSVPDGFKPEDNVVMREGGSKPNLIEGALPHWELAKKYDIIDLELGVKLTGAGFPVYKGKGAKLQRALVAFFLDEAEKAGYTEYLPPFMVNEESAYATGQLPDKEGQMYVATEDNLYLIPTAEVPLTNIFRGDILKESDFPVKICGYSPCWRREAGSYGKDVRGLNRVHQFEKVEIVRVSHPSQSYDALEEMTTHVEGILAKLELPYRILRLCGGDMTFASSLTYDFETFSSAQGRWLEVSSVSNFETFQSNRMKLRFKDADGKTQLAHTLNGSALALARIVATMLENHQVEDGILIPKALQAYTGFDKIS